ncbi:type II toxin-antitoxin system PemK/MazF family toxin [Natronobeatus ordinarius]|uniref:type II toxin-antitoxin system PemK/MazF family toxin n=1 Tax=Natronobeatus ordinarius TaxID=2963433 RepID=UPI0020CF39C9|nr:type II toxin-antitoxin system PemK/MazF family toxin [Natronobeatus ordinarius]
MTVTRGTIVYAADPFKDGDAGRPWVVVNTSDMPFHGEQYVALTLTTKTWHDERIPIEDEDLIDGGLPEDSSILPWAVASLDPDDINRELGVLNEAVVDAAVATLAAYVGARTGEDG